MPIPFVDIAVLLSRFEDCLRKILVVGSPPQIEENTHETAEPSTVRDLVNFCVDTLQLVIPISREDIVEWQYIATIRLTVHLIDLGVMSYAGAHVNDFGKHCVLETPRIFNLLTPFSRGLYKADGIEPYLDDTMADEEVIAIQMQQCHLLCLDEFHDNQPVWVFSSPLWTPTAKLLLSTSLEPFADMWGPLWKAENVHTGATDRETTSTLDGESGTSFRPISEDHNPSPRERQPHYLYYVVGNGRIVRWPHSEYSPILLTSEVFCHWISNREDVHSNSLDLAGEIYETDPFDGSEIMLIGAFTIGKNNLSVNSYVDTWEQNCS